ncbi:MAG: tRNA (adenosine(37)-N6)-threonylcarbamoyltransferase complex dimerization subunit type 1 TsaB [Bacteroidales bacterium]|nr:tRNA (adenosine(37)-N6)-threonylcarbamoyltransferase complex dimerization subunit type 1 TsaB [Bacteroidales bacterium]MBK8882540.1 tRNA (adenosine(37)-N6)-threonylcarbamoyltransferase complex dimerization subunit type 1 TsaB [Bacteroidales bacterium]
MVICIETATNLCSVALCSNAGVISLKESADLKSHASMLTVFIAEALKENGISAGELEAVAVGKGPGSYTGLRIGVSVAKGISYGASLPLIGIETTLSMFWGMAGRIKEFSDDEANTLFCPMIDARRMEVYNALYDSNGNKLKEISADIITADSFSDIPESKKIIFFGDGAAKCKEVINRKNAYFADDFRISAAHMLTPVYQALNNDHFEDVAYFEPFYLKNFITSIPRKNIFGK